MLDIWHKCSNLLSSWVMKPGLTWIREEINGRRSDGEKERERERTITRSTETQNAVREVHCRRIARETFPWPLSCACFVLMELSRLRVACQHMCVEVCARVPRVRVHSNTHTYIASMIIARDNLFRRRHYRYYLLPLPAIQLAPGLHTAGGCCDHVIHHDGLTTEERWWHHGKSVVPPYRFSTWWRAISPPHVCRVRTSVIIIVIHKIYSNYTRASVCVCASVT